MNSIEKEILTNLKEYIGCFIVLDFLILFGVLFSMSVLIQYFMIPSLHSITNKYNLSEHTSGYILALGSSIPEFTTNMISATTSGGNINIGIGAITGSGSFNFTICLGLATFLANNNSLNLNKTLYFRDSFVYLFTLTLITYFLMDNIIEPIEAVILVIMYPIYLYISIKFTEDEVREGTNENNPQKLNISAIDETIKLAPNEFDFNSDKSEVSKFQQDSSYINTNINIDQSIYYENSEHKTEETEALIYNKEDISTNDKDGIVFSGKKDMIGQELRENKNEFVSYFESITRSLVWFYSCLLPSHKKYPILAFLTAILFTFVHTSITIQLIQLLSAFTQIKASFLGMTLIGWAGSIGDTINATIATKIRAPGLLSTSILGSQVVNLQVCLGVPWLISIIKNQYNGKPTIINFGKRNPLKYLLPLFIVVMISIFIMMMFNVNLNKKSGTCLIILYFIYLFFEIDINMS